MASSAERELKHLREDNVILKRENERLRKDNATSKRELEDEQDTKATSIKKANRSENDSKDKQITALETSLELKTKECDSSVSELKKLKEELEISAKRIDNYEFEVDEMQKLHEDDQQMIKDLKQHQQSGNDAYRHKDVEINNLKNDLSHHNALVKQLRRDIDRDRQTIYEIGRTKLILEHNLEKCEIENQRIQEDHAAMEAACSYTQEVVQILDDLSDQGLDLSPAGLSGIITDWMHDHGQLSGRPKRPKKARVTSLADELPRAPAGQSQDSLFHDDDYEDLDNPHAHNEADDEMPASLDKSTVASPGISYHEVDELVSPLTPPEAHNIDTENAASYQPECKTEIVPEPAPDDVPELPPGPATESAPAFMYAPAATSASIPWWIGLGILVMALLVSEIFHMARDESGIWLAANDLTRFHLLSNRGGGGLLWGWAARMEYNSFLGANTGLPG